ncbi:hypothetical protein PILCRDRAFT_66336 [Piloderma croceum F 1598]|uniref:Uncharacterized protein n=1 Tax=Piloderma croceum (strain F 1598) TaxID=765440 RepID=A0A0C3G3P8_PILCF|nr:hypothetical protein PILCRDRAFT_66336 [Piloderma croceum F 1598]
MAEWLQQLDPSKLVLGETVLAFAISPFTSPPYNLPIFLFGMYAQENTEGVQSLQTFTGLVGVSVVFDIIYMAQNQQNWFSRMITIFILILKLPTFFACALALRQRGSQFAGLGIRGADLGGPTGTSYRTIMHLNTCLHIPFCTVWSMPGGFTSGGGHQGYQTVDEEPPIQTPRGPASQGRPPQGPPPAPGAQPSASAPGIYQSV